MTRKQISLYIRLPVAMFILYMGGMILAPNLGKTLQYMVFYEYGIIELGTAVCFFLAATAAFRLFYRGTILNIGKWRSIYLLLGLAALFVALEEINYGQYFFEFETFKLLAEHNCKGEMNLHNLFANKPARIMNLIATIGFPIIFIILPVLTSRSKSAYHPGKWPYYILPRQQLIVFVVIGQLMSWVDDVFGFFGISNAWTRATEMKELYWSLAVLFWVVMLNRRLIVRPEKTSSAGEVSPCLSQRCANMPLKSGKP